MAKEKKKSYSKVLREKGNKRVKYAGKDPVNLFAGESVFSKRKKPKSMNKKA